MSEYKKHREFIHDVSNQLTISDGAIKRLKKLQASEAAIETSEDLKACMDMADKYISECIQKLREYRLFIHDLESESKK